MVALDSAVQAAVAKEPAPSGIAYLLDRDSEGVLRSCFSDLGLADGRVVHGSIDTAIEGLARQPSPPLLVVDVSGIEDPVIRLNRLAEVCDPSTEVIVVGERNDIALYRSLKAFGVAEYFFKPLVSGVVIRALSNLATGSPELRSPRTGKLVIVLGVRGGMGATTIAVNLALCLSEEHKRRALLVDFDLQTGDAALQLDMTPGHALHEALDHPERVDDLFLERGVATVTARLSLFAALEPLTDLVIPDEEAALQLLSKLLHRYRYVVVDLPTDAALKLNRLLHLPSLLLLVSDGSLISAREVGRWRERIGPNTPERSMLHILTKRGADWALPDKEFLRALVQPPDIVIPYDRDVAAASNLGARRVQKCASMRQGMAALSRHLLGESSAQPASLWKRIFR
jgi:pilus assembly protein CpaE